MGGNIAAMPSPESPEEQEETKRQLSNIREALSNSRPTRSGSRESRRLKSIKIEKPKRMFFRTHRDFRPELQLIETADKSLYLPAPQVLQEIDGELFLKEKVLVLYITSKDDLGIWPISADSSDSWTESAHDLVEAAEERWFRLESNGTTKTYEGVPPHSDLGEPNWPIIEPEVLFEEAFKRRFVDSLDHPVLKELYGDLS